MSEIKVSIRVLCYNQEKYIRQTLDSILNQEHPYTYELIVCDDASLDSTPQIVAEYAARYKEIVPVLRKKNIGLIANYFDSISRCRGEYIMGCAGDDYWLPGKVASQVKYLDAHPEIGMIHSDAISVSENGEFIRTLQGCQHDSMESLIFNYNIWTATIALRKKDFSEYISEIHPMDKNWIMEDLPISLWFKSKGKMAYLPGVFAAYRVVENSMCHQTSPEKSLLLRTSSVDVVDYYKNSKNIDISEKFYLNWKFRRLMIPQNIKFFTVFYEDLLEECKGVLSKKNYIVYKLRIEYPLVNTVAIQYEKFIPWLRRIINF